MSGTESVRVEQCDRDAAFELLGGTSPEGLMEGRADSLSLVQALARHRIAAIEATTEAAAKLADDWDLSNSPNIAVSIAEDLRNNRHLETRHG